MTNVDPAGWFHPGIDPCHRFQLLIGRGMVVAKPFGRFIGRDHMMALKELYQGQSREPLTYSMML